MQDIRNAFIIKISDGCDDCHTRFQDIYGKARYEVLGNKIGIVTTSVKQLNALQTSNPEQLADFIPMHPEMKLHPELRDIKKSCLESRGNNPGGSVLALVHHMNLDQYDSMIREINAFINPYNGIITLKTKYPVHIGYIYMTLYTSDCNLLPSIASYLTHQHVIVHVERVSRLNTFNRWSNGLCDTGDTHYAPLNHDNFTGLGEIVGVADTGLDMYNCYFYDTTPTPYTNLTTLLTDHTHRKVIQYVTYQDRNEVVEGHGTHVSATLAGRAYASYGDYARYNGIVSDAKIAFFDISDGSGGGNNVSPPEDLHHDLLAVQYATGAR